MAMVIDSLVIDLGLDASKFTRGQAEALRSLRQFERQSVRSGQTIESGGRRILDTFGKIRTEALATIVGVFGGANLVNMVNHITSLDASSYRLGKTMGISAKEVQVWQSAFKQMGGTGEAASAALAGLSLEMNRFMLTGQSQMLPVLTRLGISLTDSNGRLKTSAQLWLEIADAVKGMDSTQATALLSMIPGANQEMINFALMGRKAMEEYLAAGRAIVNVTKESTEEAIKYQAVVGRLETAWTSVSRTLTTAVAPVLSTIFEGITRLFSPDADPSHVQKRAADLKRLGLGTGEGNLFDLLSIFGISKGGRSLTGVGGGIGGAGFTVGDIVAPGGGAALRVKPGGGTMSPAMEALATDLQANIAGLVQFTAFNDAFHGGRGAHGAGRALDFTIADPGQSAAIAAAVRARLAAMGLSGRVIDEYKNPSAHATGGHIHVSIGGAGAASRLPITHGAGLAAGGAAAAPGAVAGGSTSTMTATIGTINVNAPRATNADSIASEIDAALQRQLFAGSFNSGAQ